MVRQGTDDQEYYQTTQIYNNECIEIRNAIKQRLLGGNERFGLRNDAGIKQRIWDGDERVISGNTGRIK